MSVLLLLASIMKHPLQNRQTLISKALYYPADMARHVRTFRGLIHFDMPSIWWIRRKPETDDSRVGIRSGAEREEVAEGIAGGRFGHQLFGEAERGGVRVGHD